MKLGIIIYSNDAETVWNAFRFANLSLQEGDTVNIFLLAKGVDYEKLNSEKFNIEEQTKFFLNQHGKIFACGTCLKSRGSTGATTCPLSTMKDLHQIVKESDKIVTF